MDLRRRLKMFDNKTVERQKRDLKIKENAEALISQFPPETLAQWERISLAKGTSLNSLRAKRDATQKNLKALVKKDSVLLLSGGIVSILTLFLLAIFTSRSTVSWVITTGGSILYVTLIWFRPVKKIMEAEQLKNFAENRYNEQSLNFLRYVEPLLSEGDDKKLFLRVLGPGYMLTELTQLALHVLIAEDLLKKVRLQIEEIPSKDLLRFVQRELESKEKFEQLFNINEKLEFGIEKREAYDRAKRAFQSLVDCGPKKIIV